MRWRCRVIRRILAIIRVEAARNLGMETRDEAGADGYTGVSDVQMGVEADGDKGEL